MSTAECTWGNHLGLRFGLLLSLILWDFQSAASGFGWEKTRRDPELCLALPENPERYNPLLFWEDRRDIH